MRRGDGASNSQSVQNVRDAARQILQRKKSFDNLLVDPWKFDFRDPLGRYSAPNPSLRLVLLVVLKNLIFENLIFDNLIFHAQPPANLLPNRQYTPWKSFSSEHMSVQRKSGQGNPVRLRLRISIVCDAPDKN